MHLDTYVSSIVERFCPRLRADQCFIMEPDTPANVSINFDTRDERELNEQKAKQYQVLVGSLMYASTLVRMDISYTVGKLALTCKRPVPPTGRWRLGVWNISLPVRPRHMVQAPDEAA